MSTPRVVLVGPMGSGKSTVGRRLAAALGLAFRDTDDLIEAETGATIPAIFAADGEAGFRRVEARVVAEQLGSFDGVLALGGGAVVTEATRAALAERAGATDPRGGAVVFLDVDADAAARRENWSVGRPMLATDDPREAWVRLRTQRLPLYTKVATVRIDTSALSADDVTGRILEALGARSPVRISVGGDGPAYDVVIGRDLLGELPPLLGESVRRVLLVRPEPLVGPSGDVAAVLRDAGYELHIATLPDAEAAKTLETTGRLYAQLGEAGFTRSDAIVAYGGGSVTDLAGFVAATWLRGVRVVHLPTTLLGMVDAAVGGKTGINIEAGKNLVGAFHPPAGVLCDLSTLATLPVRDLAAGMAEVVKAGFIADPRILEIVEADPAACLDPQGPQLAELVVRAVAVKARVVGEDLKEGWLREILNYGHTFAHAIEQVERYAWRHGDAVAVGLVYAAELGVRSGHLDAGSGERHRRVLGSLGLPTGYAAGRWDALLAAMRRDKKTRGDLLRFVVLDGIGEPVRLAGPSEELLRACYDAVSADRPAAGA